MRMSEPNFDAYRRYTEIRDFAPVEIIEGGKPGTRDDFIQVDYNGFRGLDKAATDRLMDKFAQVAGDGRIVEEDGAPALDTPQKARDVFESEVYLAQMDRKRLSQNGGGANMEESKIVYLDSKTISFDEYSKSLTGVSISNRPAVDEKLFDAYTREHETAHQMLGLREAGSDYVAAVRMLQSNPGPETREFLQHVTDLRAITPFRVKDKMDSTGQSDGHVAQVISSYGYGCATAFEAALNTPQSDIEKMTPEEMYENATIYDSLNSADNKVMNENGKKVRPEFIVREALLSDDDKITTAKRYEDTNMTSKTKKLIESGKFENGTPERHILEDLNAASKRMDNAVAQAAKSDTAYSPAIAPSVSNSLQPNI